MAWLTKRSYRFTLPDGSTERRKCEAWTIQYRDAAGKVRSCKGYSDKGASKQKAAKLELALAKGEQGLVDAYKVHRALPLKDHVADWLADRTAAGLSTGYLRPAKRRMELLLEGTGWKYLADVESNSFLRWRDKRRSVRLNGGWKKHKGTGATTLNHYLDVCRAFLNWCVEQKRLAANPLADVDKVRGEKLRLRRALTDDQVAALMRVTPAGRKLAYRVALSLGLRRQEMEALVWGDLRLRSTRPYVQLRAEATKARRGDRVPLPLTLAEALRAEKPAGAKDADRVFQPVPSLDWWKVDLREAGIPYVDGMGRVADFHAGTRKTLCTRMHRGNVPLAIAMRVMRHTDARLTMVDYADDGQLGADPLPEILEAPAAAAGAAPTVALAVGGGA